MNLYRYFLNLNQQQQEKQQQSMSTQHYNEKKKTPNVWLLPDIINMIFYPPYGQVIPLNTIYKKFFVIFFAHLNHD